jgi:hypothetical protein
MKTFEVSLQIVCRSSMSLRYIARTSVHENYGNIS